MLSPTGALTRTRQVCRLAAPLTLSLLATVQLLHAQPDPFLGTSGLDIRNAHGQGDVVPLRGVNLGGWLLWESWMTPMDSSGLPDDWSVRDTLTRRFGAATKDSLVAAYEDAWIQEWDFDLMAAMGMNVVRLPFWYLNVEEEDGTWRSDAFNRLDWCVTNAWQRGIYTIIDLHGAPGGQRANADTTGRIWPSAALWTNATYQARTLDIWQRVSQHYAGNPAVAGYDLLNEPMDRPTPQAYWALLDSLYRTIRTNDPGHIIIMEATCGNWDFDELPNPAAYGWTNVAYQLHVYPWNVWNDVTQLDQVADSTVQDWMNHQGWNVPCHIGEFNMGPEAAWDYAVQKYSSSGASWQMWAWKSTYTGGQTSWGVYNPNGSVTAVPNIQTDSSNQVCNCWQPWTTTNAFTLNDSHKHTLSMPVAKDDAYSADRGRLTIAAPGVLGNDTDLNQGAAGIQLQAQLVSGPAHGSLTLNTDGSFAYTANSGYSGPDPFRYKVWDGRIDSVRIATVTLSVGTNAPPPAARTQVESRPDGAGVVVPAQDLTAGTVTNVFAVARDASGTFIANVPVSWSLTNLSGGVADSDLVVAPDGKSASFSARLAGSAVIQAVADTFPGQSGSLTVNPGLVTQLLWATQPGLATNGLVFGQQPVLETADAMGNPTMIGLEATQNVSVSLSAGTGPLLGTTLRNIGTSAGNGVVTFANLQINAPGAGNQLEAAPVAGFAPTNIPDCRLWLDASDLSALALSGGLVTQWNDKSGWGNHAAAGIAPACVTNSVLPATSAGLGRAVRFDGAWTYLNVDLSALNSQPYTIIAVEVSADRGSSDSYFIGNTGGATDQALHMGYHGNTIFRLGHWADDLSYAGNFAGNTTARLWTGRLDSNAGRGIYLNGVEVAEDAVTTVVTGDLASGHIGAAFNTDTSLYKGDLAEIVVYARALSDPERTSVESYLAGKWFSAIASATSAPFTVYAAAPPLSQTNSIVAVTDNRNGSFLLSFIGSVGVRYYLQAATNLAPPVEWQPVPGSTNVVTNSSGLWSCAVTNNGQQRYFRSVAAEF